MSREYSDILLEVMRERANLLRNWKRLVKEAVEAVKEIYPEARIYITGSIAKDEWIAASDIDLIVVLTHEPSMREAAQIIEHIWEKLKLPLIHPLEIHVVGPQGLEKYKRKSLIPVEQLYEESMQ